MTVALKPHLYIDGTDVAGLTLGGAQINYGRTSPDQPDQPAFASLTLLTVDSVPQVADRWPDFGPGAFGAPSGYVVDYLDTWDGVSSRLSVGVSVEVTLESPSGYAQAYDDEWGGITVPRFTGRVSELEYLPGQVNVTAVDPTERLGYVTDTEPYPEERDTERAVRLAKLGGVDVEVTGGASILLAGDPDPVTADVEVTHPAVAQEITGQAQYARATFTATPAGKVQYRTRTTAPNPYVWARAVGHSPLGKVMTRYNLVDNPGMYEGVNAWSGSEGFASQYQGHSPTGINSVAGWIGAGTRDLSAWTTVTYDLVPTVAYTFTVWVYTLTSEHTVETWVRWRNAAGEEIAYDASQEFDTPDVRWTRSVPVTSIAPTGAHTAEAGITFRGRNFTAANFTAALFEPSPFAFPYFDGNFPNAEWIGAPSGSPSKYASPPWPLPADRVIEPDLAFRLALGDVVNTTEVTYVTYDAEGNQDTATVTATDETSVEDYGRRIDRYSTRMVDQAQAQALANAVVEAYKQPAWSAQSVTVVLTEADGREQIAAGTVTFGDSVQVGDLPNGGPSAEIIAEVIGWQDYLGPNEEWELTYHLAQHANVTMGARP